MSAIPTYTTSSGTLSRPMLLGEWIVVDGVKLGKIVMIDGKPAIQVKDKDGRRSALRGTDLLVVRITDLFALTLDGDPPPKELMP